MVGEHRLGLHLNLFRSATLLQELEHQVVLVYGIRCGACRIDVACLGLIWSVLPSYCLHELLHQ